MSTALTREKHRLALCVEKMKGLSPLEKLSRGYSYIQNAQGKNVRSISQAEKGSVLTVYVTDGKIEAEVCSAERVEYPDTAAD